MQFGCIGQEPRHRRFAGAGRPPEYQRAERARRQHTGERAVGAEQIVLPHHLIESGRTQAVGQRTGRVLVEASGGEQIGAARFGAWGHQLNTAEIFCPPRRMPMRQLLLGTLLSRSRSRVLAMASPLTSWITSPRWKPRLLA